MMSVMMGEADLHGQKKMRLLVLRVRLPKQPTGDARPLFSSVSGKSSLTEMATEKKWHDKGYTQCGGSPSHQSRRAAGVQAGVHTLVPRCVAGTLVDVPMADS